MKPCLTPEMPWEQEQRYYDSIAGVEDYLINADKMRRISIQNSQFFSETDVNKKNSVANGFRNHRKYSNFYSSDGSALLDFEEIDSYHDEDDEDDPLLSGNENSFGGDSWSIRSLIKIILDIYNKSFQQR